MRRWSDFPSDNTDRAVRGWLSKSLVASFGSPRPDERECRAIADRIMAGVDERSRALLEAVDRRYDETELNRMAGWMDRVLAGEPVQYVLGWTEFRGLRILCNSAALIPRPETEELVSWLLEKMDHWNGPGKQVRVVDVGTGTGCVALSIKQARPNWEVWGVDVSEAALSLARSNAEALSLDVHWSSGNALQEGWPDWPDRFEGIISNPPYIPEEESTTLSPQVRDHEPDVALFVPDERPLQFHEALLREAQRTLTPGGCMVAECHADFTRKVADCWQLEDAETEVLIDLQGLERAVRLIRN